MKKLLITCVLLSLATLGCEAKTQPVNSRAPSSKTDHEHASEGPHHGTLIELGNEAYHAELVHAEKSITVYILDASAKGSVPIDATEIAINLLHDGKPEQFQLAATPEANDPPGKSSRFVSTDAELAEHLDEEETEPKLRIQIEGKTYGGVIEHDHAGHDHDHKH